MRRLVPVLAGILSILGPPPGRAGDFRLMVEKDNVFLSATASGQLTGELGLILGQFIDESQWPVTILVGSWTGNLREVEATPDTCIAPLARTPARERRFRWIGVLARRDYGFYAARDRHLVLGALSEIETRGLVVGTVLNEASDSLIQTLLPNARREVVHDSRLNFRKVMAGRIDLLASADNLAPLMMAEEHVAGIERVASLATLDVDLACNPSGDRAALDALERAFARFAAARPRPSDDPRPHP